MSQQITITIDGTDGVQPDSAGRVFNAVFELLRSLDKRGWQVNAERVQWRVSEARLVNPLILTARGEPIENGKYGGGDLAEELMSGLQEIERGVKPRRFIERELKLIKDIGREYRFSRSFILSGGQEENMVSVKVGKEFFKRISRIMRLPKKIRTEYGAIEGTLIRLANDPLRDDGSATLRERFERVDVLCHATPDDASKMGQYINRSATVVLYGTITYEDDICKSIEVESFLPLPTDDKIPSLRAIHAMGLRLPNGAEVDDYLNEIRGEGDEQ